MFTLTLLASLGAQEKTNCTGCTSMLWSIDSYQNRASAEQYHLTVPRAQVSNHWGRVFFKVIRWQITSFKWSQAQVYFFHWFISNMLYMCLCHYGPALLGFWFQTDLGSENSSSFIKSTGGKDLISPWSRVGHALRPIFILWLVKIWQVSSCGKIMQHLESSLLWQQAVCVTRFDQSECVICRVIFALGKSRFQRYMWWNFRFIPSLCW